ncbi:hypothetical protein [Horticoccus sp. 23ND18S-11]|uniref:hypothetical protein n=1 Tax=Horticoccus sp. 23ND18S-11 TaxID=3391832 RepID=UPI0039C954E5
MFYAAKDMMAAKAAKTYLNNVIKAYGRVEELIVDSKRRRIELSCQLEGEVSLIGVTIEQYRLERRDEKTFVAVVASSATRPWMQAAMRQHLHGREFELPSWAAAVL